jgi:hypothetical protein
VGANTDSVVYSWTATGVYTFNFYTNGNLDSTRNYNGFIPCQLPNGVDELFHHADEIQLYPNPTRHEFSLKLNNAIQPDEIKNILIISNRGETIFTSDFYREKIRTENFAKGIYFIIIKTTDKVITKKLVVH